MGNEKARVHSRLVRCGGINIDFQRLALFGFVEFLLSSLASYQKKEHNGTDQKDSSENGGGDSINQDLTDGFGTVRTITPSASPPCQIVVYDWHYKERDILEIVRAVREGWLGRIGTMKPMSGFCRLFL